MPFQLCLSSLLTLAIVAKTEVNAIGVPGVAPFRQSGNQPLAAHPPSIPLDRIAATGWGSGAHGSDADWASGIRVYAVDQSQNCLQEWTTSGEKAPGETPDYRRTVCLNSNTFDINLQGAFSATSLEQFGSLAELRLFYWTNSIPTRIGSATWAPGRSNWEKDPKFPQQVGAFNTKSQLTATLAKTSDTTASKSVFFIENGTIKEWSMVGNSNSSWTLSPKTFTVKGVERGFNILDDLEVQVYVDIQAVSYVVNGNVYKKVYLLSRKEYVLYEIDWNDPSSSYTRVKTRVASFTATVMYNGDVPGIRVYHTEKADTFDGTTFVRELWNLDPITGPNVLWSSRDNVAQVGLAATTYLIPLAAAFQYQANNGQGWISVMYVVTSINPAEPPELHEIHRAPDGWTKIDYRLP